MLEGSDRCGHVDDSDRCWRDLTGVVMLMKSQVLEGSDRCCHVDDSDRCWKDLTGVAMLMTVTGAGGI